MPRSVAELTAVDDPAWPALAAAIAAAPLPVQALPIARAAGEHVLERLQVTTRSALGALALECGGLLVDHGWLRILCGGAPGLPDLASANGIDAQASSAPGSLLVAADVLGGRFAVDGGALGVEPGQVCYFAPDTLRWEGLDLGHGDFVVAMLSGATSQFYDGWRWPRWEQECAALPRDHGFSLWPPPFAPQGRDISAASRRAVPLGELFAFYDDAARRRDRSGTTPPPAQPSR